MPSHSPLTLLVFLAGAAFGYVLRAIISWRRHNEARRRYEETGSYGRLG
jgi:hypothetical protein